jgi:hypothetical protein
MRRLSSLEDVLPPERRTWSRFVEELPAGCTDAPEWIAAVIEDRNATIAEIEAFAALLTTGPTTLAGAVAVLEYVNSPEFQREGYCDSVSVFEGGQGNEIVEEAAENFLPMIAGTLRILAAARSDNRYSRRLSRYSSPAPAWPQKHTANVGIIDYHEVSPARPPSHGPQWRGSR